MLQKPTKQNVKLAILSEPRAIRVRSIPKTLSLVVLIQGNNLQYSSEMGRDKSMQSFHCMSKEHTMKTKYVMLKTQVNINKLHINSLRQ